MKKHMNKRIIYLGDVGREGTAKFVHSQGIASIFMDIGYKVTFVCEGWERQEIHKHRNNFEYWYTKQYITKSRLRSVENIIEWTFGGKLFRLFKKIVAKEKPEYVVFYGHVFEPKLIKYCRKNDIGLIIERADWFEKDDATHWFEKHIVIPRGDRCIREHDKYADGIIAISGLFYDYYTKLGVPVIQIPPVFDLETITNVNIETHDKLRLVYAGSLGGNKDKIIPAINAVCQVNREQKKIQFDIVGISEAELDLYMGKKEWNTYGILAHGKLPHEDTLKIIRNADFSFLLRENKRYAKAGFSTKFAESMLHGVPVICTHIGGCDTMVKSYINGVLVENNEEKTIELVLNKLLRYSSEEIYEIKQAALKEATMMFDMHRYSGELLVFLESISK